MEIRVIAPVRASEDGDKVLDAVRQIFPTLRCIGEDEITAESSEHEALENLRELIRKQAIRDTVRPFLIRRINGESLSFSLNKQAAARGYVNLVDFKQPLGAIDVLVKDETLEALVDWLCD